VRRFNSSAVCAAMLFVALPLSAQQSPQPSTSTSRPAVAGAASATAIATVEKIDQATREVSLRKEDGELVSIKASEDVRNLAQVKVGDKVIATYEIGAIVALQAPGTGPVGRTENTEVARAAPGSTPRATIRNTVTLRGNVVGVDAKARTVTVQGPERTVTLPVEDDIDLSKVKVGEQMEAVFQESLALRVEPAPK
jgi:Cu/Ag efflux protein CusF